MARSRPASTSVVRKRQGWSQAWGPVHEHLQGFKDVVDVAGPVQLLPARAGRVYQGAQHPCGLLGQLGGTRGGPASVLIYIPPLAQEEGAAGASVPRPTDPPWGVGLARPLRPVRCASSWSRRTPYAGVLIAGAHRDRTFVTVRLAVEKSNGAVESRRS